MPLHLPPVRHALPGAALRLALAVSLATPAGAQVVRGTTTGLGGAPTPGVVVLLLDSSAATVRRALSGEGGVFTIAAPGPGTYSLHTLRLGYRPARVPLPALAAGRDTVLRIALEPVPLALPLVAVRARRRCGSTGDEGGAAALWSVVRTALEAQSLTPASGEYVMRTMMGNAWLDARGRASRTDAPRFREGPALQPFASLSADSLSRVGYVADARGIVDWRDVAQRGTGDDIVFRGPDAAVLLSDRFARDHCFQVVASPDSAQREVGLAFQPARRAGDAVDIRGTLWVDRQSSELRRIAFTYDGLPSAIGDDLGGTVEYLALPGGGWILRRWEIRMPTLGRGGSGAFDARSGRTRPEWQLRRAGTQLGCGEVVELRRAGRVAWTARDHHLAFVVVAPPGVEGRAAPVRVGMLAAAVAAGGGDAASAAPRLLPAGERGRYQVDSLLPSMPVRLLLWNLDADSLAIAPDTVTLRPTPAADTAALAVRAPGVREVVRRLCGREAGDTASRAIVGVVRRAGAGPVGGVVVQASFIGGAREVAPGRLVARSERRTVRTDAAGRFLVCDVPAERAVSLFARAGTTRGEAASVRVPDARAYEGVGLAMP
jgi:hypothetical protein